MSAVAGAAAKEAAKAAVKAAAKAAAKETAKASAKETAKKGARIFGTDMAIGVIATQGMGMLACKDIEDKDIQKECFQNANGLKGMSREDWVTMVGFALGEMVLELALGPIGLALIFISIGGMLIDAFWDPLGLNKQMSLFQALGMRHTFLKDIRKSSTEMADPDDPTKKISKTFTDPSDPDKVYKSYDEVPDKYKDISRMRYPYKLFPKDTQTPHLTVIDYMLDYVDHVMGILEDGVYRDKMTLPAYQMNLKNDYWKHVLTYFKNNGFRLMIPYDKEDAEQLISFLKLSELLKELGKKDEIPDLTINEDGSFNVPPIPAELSNQIPSVVTEHSDENDIKNKHDRYKQTVQAIKNDPSSVVPNLSSSRSSPIINTLIFALIGIGLGALVIFLYSKWAATQSNTTTRSIQSKTSTRPIQSKTSTRPIQSKTSTRPIQSNTTP